MKSFINVEDIGNLDKALAEAVELKNDRYKYQHLGKNKTLMMIFFNNSLRTRLSTQKAAQNLGMNVIVLDVNAGAWKLETERGVIMDGDKSEHLLEAIPVMGCYCDLIGIRSFAGLQDREYDYAETVLNQFIKYSGRPVFAMETATVHPLQAFADLITIKETMKKVGLDPNSKLHIKKYSLGMRQRLGLAQAIMENPDLLILDEPMNGLDNEGVKDIRKILLGLKEEGKTILLVSHNSEDIEILCDEIYYMDKGKMSSEPYA